MPSFNSGIGYLNYAVVLLTMMRCICVSILLSALCYWVEAQSEDDERLLHQSLAAAIDTSPADQKSLYNGGEYLPSTIVAGGHPYFLTDSLKSETVRYENIRYDGINIIYDAFRDVLVIEDNMGNRICPVKKNVQGFTIGSHRFKQLLNVNGLAPGFYDMLVDDSVSLCAKRTKQTKGLQWKVSSTYYILVGLNATPVFNKKDLLKTMPGKGNVLRNYLRENKLTFRRKRESSLISVVEYLSSLKPQDL